jgi:hypothetical protein
MKYAVEMGSGAMIYVPSYIKIGSGIQKLNGADTHTDSKVISHKHTSVFSKSGKYLKSS